MDTEQTAVIQTKSDLDEFFAVEDPWHYETTVDDKERRARLLSAIPERLYRRTLEIGCGNGFVTVHLPGQEVVGCDLSEAAIDWAGKRIAERPDSERFTFFSHSIFDLTPEEQGTFDLIVITGVLYPQYIGSSWSLVNDIIDRLLEPGGILATCHIYEWCRHRIPFLRIDQAYYPYREYTHRLEVYLK